MDKDDQWGLKKTQSKSLTLWPTPEQAVTAQPHHSQQPHWAPIRELADLMKAVSFTHSCLSHESLDTGPQHCKVSSSLISAAVLPQHTAAKPSYWGADNCLLISSRRCWGQQGSAAALIPRAQIFQAWNICLNNTKRGAGSKTTGYLKSRSPFLFPGCSHLILYLWSHPKIRQQALEDQAINFWNLSVALSCNKEFVFIFQKQRRKSILGQRRHIPKDNLLSCCTATFVESFQWRWSQW